MRFLQKLQYQFDSGKFLCGGLDPDVKKFPACLTHTNVSDKIFAFNRAIIDATYVYAAAYKPNSAFYEKHGPQGYDALQRTIEYIRERDQHIVVILDAKRGDIDNTNEGYVISAFELDRLNADAITIHPYLGYEANKPFLQDPNRGAFVLCKTSNKDSGEFQNIGFDEPLYQTVAFNVETKWNQNENCGLVVGATYPEELAYVRQAAPHCTILIPGVGAQGGDLNRSVRAAMDEHNAGFLINNSRAILYASSGADYAEAARKVAMETHYAILRAREESRILAPTCEERAVQILNDAEAVMTGGHFVYTHGDHGDCYVNKDTLFLNPTQLSLLGSFIAKKFVGQGIETVAGPAVGAIGLTHCVALYLSKYEGRTVAAVFADKVGKHDFEFNRGYASNITDKKVLAVEDIFNSGGSAKTMAQLIRTTGGTLVATAGICNRGNVKAEDIDTPILYTLVSFDMKKYPADECPLCAAHVPINTQVGKGKEFLAAQQEIA